MNKQEWIKGWTTGRWESANKDVISFIANVLYYDEAHSNNIYNMFACKYCYYFAVMLKEAFKRGTICWHRNYGHIVWVDTDGIAYDISGVFYDYDEGDLLNVEFSLGDMIVDFKHNGEEYHSGSKQFKDWTEHYGMSEIYAISDIYRNMPKEDIDDRFFVSTNALMYWNIHKEELSEYYAKHKNERRNYMYNVKELNTFAVAGNILNPEEPVHLTLYNEDEHGNTSDDVVILLNQNRLMQLVSMLNVYMNK